MASIVSQVTANVNSATRQITVANFKLSKRRTLLFLLQAMHLKTQQYKIIKFHTYYKICNCKQTITSITLFNTNFNTILLGFGGQQLATKKKREEREIKLDGIVKHRTVRHEVKRLENLPPTMFTI